MADGVRVAAVVHLMESLMVPPDKNCSDRMDTPSAREFIAHLEPFQEVLLLIAAAFTLVVCMLALVHWFFVYSFVSIETRRNKLYWLVTLFPIVQHKKTQARRNGVGMNPLAVGNLKHLLKKIKTTVVYTEQKKNIRRLEWMVLQAPVVRALIIVSDIIAVAEMREEAKTFLRYSDVFSVGSLLLAIFGVHTLARVTSNKLSEYCFMTVFRFVDVSLLFFSAQQPMLFQNILLRFDLITCGPLLTAQENATFVCNFVIICEMFVLCLLATVLLAPRRNAMFDNYRRLKTSSVHDTDESELGPDDLKGTALRKFQLLKERRKEAD
ncbi:hypothetical protein TELCIR_02640 [Teladorsagia circumcincta]|uniref:Uncharacterized protein n=1 Tax=Teladorsagia circumcincta TaxID=45464 RepID=A0A2G9UYM0_TELCI|nr:hypothetical protein TELCIR_02640 [Teladorsagia circumcincta]